MSEQMSLFIGLINAGLIVVTLVFRFAEIDEVGI
jgi:hypothetical protein